MDLGSSLVILLVIVMILTDMFGLMYWWSIQLNAVSLVNLVMAVGIRHGLVINQARLDLNSDLRSKGSDVMQHNIRALALKFSFAFF